MKLEKGVDSHFIEILKGEFGVLTEEKGQDLDKEIKLTKHKYMMENFHVALNVQLNKNVRNPTMPGTIDFP
jgi:hypothetical protein